MSFFDKKEDVLDLKLTPYGRHLLSRGKLKPAYYAFFDDDVVYNTHLQTTASVTDEDNSDLKNRIINETPSIKPQYTMLSVETELTDNTVQELWNIAEDDQNEYNTKKYVNIYDTQFRPTTDQNTKFLQNSIGSSKPSVNKAPRWDVQFITGEINESLTTNFTSSSPRGAYNDTNPSASVLQIPQLDVEIEWEIETASQNDSDYDEAGVANVSNVNINFYQDGSYLKYTEGQVIARFLEKNGFVKKDSYEIQVFKYDKEEDTDGNANYTNTFRRLKFMNKKNLEVRRYKIDRDILIKDPFSTTLTEDSSTVEYYFDLRVDEEIPLDDICKGLDELKSEDIFVDDLNFRCPDKVNLSGINTELGDGGGCPPPEQACSDGGGGS
jgi:hypothetical protein